MCLSRYYSTPFPTFLSFLSTNMKTSFVCFFLLFLAFMFSATASRNLGRIKKEVALQEIHLQDKIETSSYEENMELDEPTRRMAYENTDYGGTGANDRHDPKSPGRP